MFVIVWCKTRYICKCFRDDEYQDKENKFIYCLYKCEFVIFAKFL